MKQFLFISLLSLPVSIIAQTSNSPASTTPAAPVSKSVNTTVINNQPASMPGSNTNPTTGTVISLKKNKKTNGSGKNISNADSATPAKPLVKAKKKKRVN